MSLAPSPRALRPFARLALSFAFVSLAHACASAAVRAFPVAEIRPGLRVVAHTVFQGTVVDSFPLEVLGVSREGRAAGDVILARATDPRLEHTGIVAGMSGSPVYAPDGRLVGALAFGWGFSKDPICGIQPAEEMLRIWNLASEPSPNDFEGGGPLSAASPRERSSSLPQIQTPLAVAGLAPEALRLLEPWAKDNGFLLVPGGASGGGSAAAKGSKRLAPGDAVSVDLLRGDASLSAIGTVTAVDGDRVLAFGHPFFFNGPTRLPMSTAEITAILPSLESSFKIGHSVTPVGTLTQDRRAGIAGVLGPAPALLPITVRVTGLGATPDTFHYEAARQRQLVRTAVIVATISSVLARGGLPAESTWRWRLSAHYRAAGEGPRTMALDDVSGGDAFALVNELASPVANLIENDWTPVDVDRLDYDIDVSPRAEAMRVRSVRLDRPRARPGETVRALVELGAVRGPTRVETLDFRVPDTMPEQTLLLFVGGGGDWARFDAQAAPGRYRANSVDELVRRLTGWPRSSRLYLAVYGSAREVSIRGRDYPGLPPSVQMLLAEPEGRDATSAWGRASLLSQTSRDLEQAVLGGGAVQLEVSTKALSRPPGASAPDDEGDSDTED